MRKEIRKAYLESEDIKDRKDQDESDQKKQNDDIHISHPTRQDRIDIYAQLLEVWGERISQSSLDEKNWRLCAKKVLERYRDERVNWSRHRSKFNILWANVETLRPALYARCPRPDVRRRFRDEDPLGKELSDVIERALSYNLDSYDFDHVMNQAVLDYILLGRSVTRIRYQRSGEKDHSGFEEEVYAEPVYWQDFLRGPGRFWHEVEWIAFRHNLTKDQLHQQFDIPFDQEEIKLHVKKNDEKVEVWEIWDKKERQVIYLSPDLNKILDVQDDPLELKDFYPIPTPLYSFEESGNLTPVPDFWCYKDQADELDRINDRITKLVRALKARGVFDSRISELKELMQADDAELVPAENVSLLLQSGGLHNAVWFLPIDSIAKVLQFLYAQREQIKQSIYELTGISDVLRGSSQIGETATAQSIKAQYGSQRLTRRQREIQRYARDLLRLKAEVMGKMFHVKSIEKMTGKTLSLPLIKLLQEEGVAGYRIDVETDSTIVMDLQEDQRNISQLLTSIVTFVHGITPAVQNGAIPVEAAKALLLASVRRHKLGREVEDALNSIC